jgi:hypothetical protein
MNYRHGNRILEIKNVSLFEQQNTLMLLVVILVMVMAKKKYYVTCMICIVFTELGIVQCPRGSESGMPRPGGSWRGKGRDYL